MKSMPSERIAIKPYTLKELASIYQVSDRTFKKWINRFDEEIGEKIGNYYSIPQVKIIFNKLGLPGYIEED